MNFFHVHRASCRNWVLGGWLAPCSFLETSSFVVRGRSRELFLVRVNWDMTSWILKSEPFHIVFSLPLLLFVKGSAVVIRSPYERNGSLPPGELICIFFSKSNTVSILDLVSPRPWILVYGCFATSLSKNSFSWISPLSLLRFIESILFIEPRPNHRIARIIREISLNRVVTPSKPCIN